MKIIRDTWLVFQRYFWLLIRNPVWVAIGVIQPMLYLLLFAPLLKPLASMRGFPPGGAYNVFVDFSLFLTGPAAGAIIARHGYPAAFLSAAGAVALAFLLTAILASRERFVPA